MEVVEHAPDETVRLTPGPFRLSVEELAYLLGLADAAEMARSYLLVTFGEDLDAEAARQRLLAAGHSLLARGWLTPNGEEPPLMVPEIDAVIQTIAQPEFSVRLTRSSDDPGTGITLQQRGGQIVRQELELAVLHTLTPCQDQAAAIDALAETLGLPEVPTHSQPPLRVPRHALDLAMEAWSGPDASTTDSPLTTKLAADGVPPELAADLAEPGERTTIVRIDYHEDGPASADDGLLLLRGQTRYWLLQPDAESSTVQAATRGAFQTAMAAVLTGGTPGDSRTS